MEFVNVPETLITDISISDKRVLVYLASLFTRYDGCCLEDLVSHSGYRPNRHARGSNEQFKNILQRLDHQYITLVGNQTHYLHREEFFGRVYQFEFDKILNAKKDRKKINHAHAILVLSYIRCRMYRVKNGVPYYSDLLTRISESIGIQRRSISNALATLEDLKIIHSESLPRYQDHFGNWHSNITIFVNTQDLSSSDYSLEKIRRQVYKN